jgi:predicted secreted protein
MHPIIRIVLLLILASAGTALTQPASASPTKPTSPPTLIPLAKVLLEAQDATSLEEQLGRLVTGAWLS